MQMYNEVMLSPSGLSKLEREMVAVVVSSANRCYYCLVAHGAAVRQLSGDPKLKGKMQLLCVSFDPEHDTPERLKAYGEQYIGSDSKTAFANWDFAAPDKPVLAEMAKFFDVGITDEPDQTITHTLSTTLIGRDGRVVKFYPGNEWSPEQVVADVKASLTRAAS